MARFRPPPERLRNPVKNPSCRMITIHKKFMAEPQDTVIFHPLGLALADFFSGFTILKIF
jgi:hypothetical protein